MSNNKLPAWLVIDSDGESVAVALSKPVSFNNSAPTRSVVLRSPTVGEMRAAQKQSGGDLDKREAVLFASLIGCGPSDFDSMLLKDYSRIQEGYFRLMADDDGSGAGSVENPVQASA